jgi:hypothetical protein
MISYEDFADALSDFIDENCYPAGDEICRNRTYKENLKALYEKLK